MSIQYSRETIPMAPRMYFWGCSAPTDVEPARWAHRGSSRDNAKRITLRTHRTWKCRNPRTDLRRLGHMD